MKKMLVMLAIVVAAFAANAASFNWSAAMVYGSDGATKYTGVATLYCVEMADWSTTGNVASGTISKTATEFSSDSFEVGKNYSFYFTIESNGKLFTSKTVTQSAMATQTATIAFGSMATATKDAGNWKGGGGDAPEPTSGLLLLIGGAMLALRRKQK